MRAHLDLVTEDLRRRPVYERFVLIHAVDHDRASPPHVVNALLRQLLHTRGLYYNVEAVWVVFL